MKADRVLLTVACLILAVVPFSVWGTWHYGVATAAQSGLVQLAVGILLVKLARR